MYIGERLANLKTFPLRDQSGTLLLSPYHLKDLELIELIARKLKKKQS